MLVAEFFAKQQVFITGGSGFIGKALIEKLLRSCPDIGNIYLLIRGKKGQRIHDRLEAILKLPLFDSLREANPKIFEKVHAIEGDCMKLGLGISSEDLKKLKDISIIYHAAASVRFDDHLRAAILMNTRGTYELVKLAQTMDKLKVFMHISTTYCNPDKHLVEEKVYPGYADWRTTIKLAETYDQDTLDIFNFKYSSEQPNTYTFTKNLAERIINDYKNQLPMVILRPSIVISSIDEPVPGWVDNFNGPIGLLMACAAGIMHTNYSDPDVLLDLVPVDMVVRAIVTATYKKGSVEAHNSKSTTEQLCVYNCASLVKLRSAELIERGKNMIRKHPMEKTLWYPGGSITSNLPLHLFRLIVMQIFMAILVDAILCCTKTKPFLVRLQRRICITAVALNYFLNNDFVFKNENTLNLEQLLSAEDVKNFGIKKCLNVDIDKMLVQNIYGAKLYLMNEPAVCSFAGLVRFHIIRALHYLIIIMGAYFGTRTVLKFLLGKYL